MCLVPNAGVEIFEELALGHRPSCHTPVARRARLVGVVLGEEYAVLRLVVCLVSVKIDKRECLICILKSRDCDKCSYSVRCGLTVILARKG